jgi:Ferritin-like domain
MIDTKEQGGINRGQFFRNAGKGGLVLATSGGILAAVESNTAFAKGGKKSDITTLQAAYTAESLAVVVYSAILKNFSSFRRPKLENRDYFVAALKNEKDHRAFLGKALGSKKPTGLKFEIPAKVTKTGQSLLNTGVALETAFVEAYLGASQTFSSAELRTVAAKLAANEATHFSFFDAAAGGHGVLPSLPKSDTIPHTVKKLEPFFAASDSTTRSGEGAFTG